MSEFSERPRPKSLNLWGLVGITYGLVIATAVLAIGSYFYFRASVRPGDQADPNPMRRIRVGTVWVPIYEQASYFDPTSMQEKAISQGTVKFRTKDGAGAVLAFYQNTLKEGGFVTLTTGNAGGSVQAVRRGGKTTVLVTVSSASGSKTGENTTGEIRTLNHEEPKQTSPYNPSAK
ncbi:MAG: hypothetical protein ABI995_03820 [Acidobacteriota bacterium]